MIAIVALVGVVAGELRAVLKSNYDGDTITVDLVNQNDCIPDVFAKSLPIRVLGVDCPELRGQCMLEKCLGRKAKQFTQSQLSDARIRFVNEDRDKYFRVLADVMYTPKGESTEKNLAEELIKEKLGVEYYGKTKVTDWCDFTSRAFYLKHTIDCMEEDPCVATEIYTKSPLTTAECNSIR